MPFEQFTPRSFTSFSVRANAPAAPGIYGLSNAREWIFIGETDNIQAALMQDLQRKDSPLYQHSPTGFVFEICEDSSRRSRHDQLVRKYAPVCNRLSAGNEIGGAA